MDLKQAMEARHSVRRYEPRPLAEETAAALRKEIDRLNAESGLHIQLVLNEPRAFDGFMAHYGHFSGVTNYFALVGNKKDPLLEEKCGYYGETLVLSAQTLGLNTCWVALTFKKIPSAYRVEKGEKLAIVIALGYGETEGKPHVSKSAETVGGPLAGTPDWYRAGVAAVLLAPTAVNQQKFRFSYENGLVRAETAPGVCARIDLGIAKRHFELGAGKDAGIWESAHEK